MHRLGRGRVMFAVEHASASGHTLHVARLDNSAVAHAVAMLQSARHYIGDNFHVAMGMHIEAGATRDAIFINDPQAAKAHLLRVVVISEGKGVITVEPAVLGVPSLIGLANLNHTRAVSALRSEERRVGKE